MPTLIGLVDGRHSPAARGRRRGTHDGRVPDRDGARCEECRESRGREQPAEAMRPQCPRRYAGLIRVTPDAYYTAQPDVNGICFTSDASYVNVVGVAGIAINSATWQPPGRDSSGVVRAEVLRPGGDVGITRGQQGCGLVERKPHPSPPRSAGTTDEYVIRIPPAGGGIFPHYDLGTPDPHAGVVARAWNPHTVAHLV